MVAQIKAHVASLEGIALEDQVVLPEGTPLEDDAVLTQCGVQALSTLEVAGRMLGGKVHGSLACTGKVRGGQTGQEEAEDRPGQAVQAVQPAHPQCGAHLWQEEGP
ncbi:ubiquitin-like protein FUBI [Ochotona princeps]|uniref:ubiquitin-like protein FUBI n=1 Tax=Ochotona princeps TaxID=9978 RepID=UPI00271472AC|nr:ubiquitin-like protein FUBI [Ochotona princeps]